MTFTSFKNAKAYIDSLDIINTTADGREIPVEWYIDDVDSILGHTQKDGVLKLGNSVCNCCKHTLPVVDYCDVRYTKKSDNRHITRRTLVMPSEENVDKTFWTIVDKQEYIYSQGLWYLAISNLSLVVYHDNGTEQIFQRKMTLVPIQEMPIDIGH